MWRVPGLETCLRRRRGTWHVLARRRRGVGLLSLPPRLRVGNWLCCLDLYAKPGPGGSGGSGVGGWDRLGVRLGGWRVIVLLVGGEVLRRLTRVGRCLMILALGMRRVVCGWSTLRTGYALVCRLVLIPWEVFVVRHIVVQLRGVRKLNTDDDNNKHKLKTNTSVYLCAGVLWVAVHISEHTGEGVDFRVNFGVITCWLFWTTMLVIPETRETQLKDIYDYTRKENKPTISS